jgi:CarboxypepD_reg-like domain
MNCRHAVFLCFLLLTLSALSQRTINGVVVNATSGEPIAGSSIFISNTSKGTVSDRQGNFELTDVPIGKQDLVVSSVGYETFAYSFTAEQLPLKLKVQLNLKVRELQNVTVEPSVEEGWEKWGKTFTENFIGSTPNATLCSIKNQKDIHFRYYRKSNRVIAYSDQPIVVINKALGYSIHFQLEDFEVNFSAGTTQYFGYPYFEDMGNGNDVKKKWRRNRETAFNGSVMHFMRSIFNNTLAENGFEVHRMVREMNLEKERVKNVYRTRQQISHDPKTRTMTVNIGPSGPTDSTEYYNRILNQKDYTDVYGRDLIVADSLLTGAEGSYKIIFFKDYLYVTYKKELEDKEFLAFHREGRAPTFQRSHIWLVTQSPVSIDANGSYFPPQEVFTMGYWAWNEKLADTLPIDYVSESAGAEN